MATPATSPPRALRRDAEQNRERILRAAREVFAERGLDVTLHDIAGHAGLGVGTVYRRFPNRDALIDALFVDNFDHLAICARECLELADPWHGFVTYVEESVAMMANDRGLWTVMTTATSKGRNFLVARDRLGKITNDLIVRAQASGALRPDFRHDDLPVLHVILGSGADFLADAGPGVWRRYLGFVIDGLCTRRDAPSALPAEVPTASKLDLAMDNWRPGKR